jgi:hypothetical protein
MLRLHNQNR